MRSGGDPLPLLLRLDLHSSLETHAGPHERDERGGVETPSVAFRHLEQLERHDEARRARAGPPFVTPSRSRTVANVDSIGLVVRRCFQCSAG